MCVCKCVCSEKLTCKIILNDIYGLNFLKSVSRWLSRLMARLKTPVSLERMEERRVKGRSRILEADIRSANRFDIRRTPDTINSWNFDLFKSFVYIWVFDVKYILHFPSVRNIE